MTISQPRSGFTLPVFACAAAVASLRYLQQQTPLETVQINLIDPPQTVEIPIAQIAKISDRAALAITHSDPGDNLDLTRNTPIWAIVEWQNKTDLSPQITIAGGEGIGKQSDRHGQAAIYTYAHKLLQHNLQVLLAINEAITVKIILPEGRKLAERTANKAFGVVEGLSLLGTTGISQPLSSPQQLEIYREELSKKAAEFDTLVFCVGENGLDLARNLGIEADRLVKTANWLGPLLVTAGVSGVRSLLLFGYHGKLIKLAGGIFHTHHHLADGRLEILTAHCAKIGLPTNILEKVFQSTTTEAALQLLRQIQPESVDRVYTSIAETIDRRSQEYIRKHGDRDVCIGSVLFDRDRNIIVKSQNGTTLFSQLWYNSLNN
ncbi:cobalt-precorrin-5B (C(1))-methyltransferase CbiD [Spirulina sp. 06S082]|nr:cobalt-precorrin-5B (C(1))-methyltransferase CbiD [Spirulina sp. 06S082]MEA5470793.1 cobalt-precorrin-5B (C(1))-methyltransferase CbiD [Spirulina sp. 06S082]